jgi:hypothetical protein
MSDLACHKHSSKRGRIATEMAAGVTTKPHLICLDEADQCPLLPLRVAVPQLGSVAIARANAPEHGRVRQ